jgi:hypothetical protein
MSLSDAIRQIPDYASLTAAEVRAALLAYRVAPLSGSDRIWNYDRVRSEFSVQLAEGIHFGLIAQGLTGAAASFTANGLDATHQSWLDNADLLKSAAQNPPDDVTFARLKYAGYSRQPSLWESAFPGSPAPELAEIETALAGILGSVPGADVLLAVNRTDGTTVCSLQVLVDGQAVVRQALREGQGSTAERALVDAIESAVDTFLGSL